MVGSGRRLSRRTLLASGAAAMRLLAQESKGKSLPAESRRYSDPSTEFDVYRLTDPAFSSTVPAHYNRFIAHNSAWMIFGSDRAGSAQAYRLDLKNATIRQLTEASNLDVSSLTLTPDNRSFCYFAGPSLMMSTIANLRERELYRVQEGWERCAGLSVGPDGTHAIFAEKNGDGSRLRMVPFAQGAPRTVLQSPFVMSHPIQRPMRAQILYRQEDAALWLVNLDGAQNHVLKTADGKVGPAYWAPDGRTLLYLNFPEDHTQLNNIRELTPDNATDRLVAKTSQYVSFGFNRDTSVFCGASRNVASPMVLLLLRITRRELTLCEHKCGHPETVTPFFAPDSQRLYFQSDRDGKPAIYDVHIDKLVEKTEIDERSK